MVDSLSSMKKRSQAQLTASCALKDSVQALSKAVGLTPDSHPDGPSCLNDLGASFHSHFQRVEELRDFEQMIVRFEDAVDLTPECQPDKSSRLITPGQSFLSHSESLGDLGQGISLYSHVASTTTGSVTTRFHASLQWISCAHGSGHHSLLHAYSFAIGLLPELAWMGLSPTHRYRELMRVADVVREAAAAALDSGFPEAAVEWLERGRLVVWRELSQLCRSYDGLSAVHVDPSDTIGGLSAMPEHDSLAGGRFLSSLSELTQGAGHRAIDSLGHEGHGHHMLVTERHNPLQEIKGLPEVLPHREFSQLRASANSGPIVILNAAKSRCDALIVLADTENVIHVPLPNFTLGRITDLLSLLKSLHGDTPATPHCERGSQRLLQDFGKLETILSVLWKCIVKPVLDSLAFCTPGTQSRIFWCPTGPFMFLPIHAAGFYDIQYSQPGHKVSDFVVSSYIPLLSILAPSPDLAVTSCGELRILVVRQPPSDGQPRLPGVDIELEHIKAILRNSSARTTLLESSVGTVEEVLDLMKEADWVHFACHGIQDTANPADSGLCLANERRLKLSDVVSLSRPRGGLAFLAACQTAAGDEDLSNEAVHIAAGMLFAGYRGVIGSMWSINDRIVPGVVRDVYEQLFRRPETTPDDREAAQALQDVVRRLRGGGASFSEWIPFIHMGL